MNLVIIVSDTFRWDYLGAYGNEWIKTPNLDRLASQSAVFTDAYAEGLPTIPVRRVIKTGRPIFPFTYRAQASDMVQLPGWHPLFDEDVTLSEHLRQYDYYSCFVTDVYHMMKPGKNFHRGYDNWFWIRGQEGDPYALTDPDRVRALLDECKYGAGPMRDRPWIIQHLNNRKDWQTDADTSVAKVMLQATKYLDDYSLDNPFFMYVDCFDPHEPWDPPLDFARLYDPEYAGMDGCIPPLSTEHMTEQQVRNVKTAYAAEVTLVDKWVGYLLDRIEAKGILDNTVIVFTSDHGCMMGEQGEIHKGVNRLRNQCTRLPLFIRHPKGEAAGQRVAGFCQHQDIMPTCLKIMGLDVPERCLGRDIWPQTKGEGDAPDYVVSAFGSHACIRTVKWNYVQPWTETPQNAGARFELYDLENDPEELTNVLADNREVAAELKQRLEDHIKRMAPLTAGSFQSCATTGEAQSFAALPTLE